MGDSAEIPATAAALRPLAVLIVEDSPDDLALLLLALRRAGYAPDYRHAFDAAGMAQALQARTWEVVVSDYTLPDYSGLLALEQVRAHDPDLPFIIVSGNIGEEVAVAAMKAGAQDYLIKGNLARLGAAIAREVSEAAVRRARRDSERELAAARMRLKALSGRLLRVQEAERRHLARELHDQVGQSLTAIKLGMDSLRRRLPDAAAQSLADDVVAIADALIDQVRALSLDLRPPQLDDLGLAAALHWLVRRHGRSGGPSVVLRAPADLPRFDPQIETAGFRVAQEALTNALRHARAGTIGVDLALTADGLTLRVCDDGGGFDLAQAQERALRGDSMGLVGMQERAALAGGTLQIVAAAGTGCVVSACFPFAPNAHPGSPP